MNLKSLREKRKLRQVDIAEKLNVDRTTVSKWETGTNSPGVKQLKGLAKILNCSIDKLLQD